MENNVKDYTNIKGWGADVDPKNDPTYPMKHHTEGEHEGYHWERPVQQTTEVEILRSNERSNYPAVFGTSVPPRGLSGMIRRFAFRYSEGSYAHWFPLVLADRVDVVEGIIEDIKAGHFPNLFAERGFRADWKYDRPNFIRKIAVGILSIAIAYAWLRRKGKP